MEIDTIRWKEFRIGDVFIQERGKESSPAKVPDGKFNLVTETNTNNGITKNAKGIKLYDGNAITISVNFAENVFYQKDPFYASVNILILRNKRMTESSGLFIASVLHKLHCGIYNYAHKISKEKLNDEYILLPVIESSDRYHQYEVDDIDWNYMAERIEELEAERIEELEAERIEELEAYLAATGLDDYRLTDEDKKILSNIPKRQNFKIASSYIMRSKRIEVNEVGIFDIIPTKEKIDANKVCFGGKYPYIARGSSNNGIRGYIDYDTKALNPANTISFGQDTATMYYQDSPYFTGDKIQIFQLNKKYGILNDRSALYLIMAMNKAFSNFSWGQQSFAVDLISQMEISLPINDNNEPDFDYMKRYICAIEKQTIASVYEGRGKVIERTKEIID